MSAYTLAPPSGADIASVLATRRDLKLLAINANPAGSWLAVDLRPSTLAGSWWVSVIEFGTGQVSFHRIPRPAPSVPLLLGRMGVPTAEFSTEPATPLAYPPHDPPLVEVERALRSVYFIQSVTGGLIKIGVAGNPEARLGDLQIGSPVDLHLIGVIKGAEFRGEAELHARFASARVRGEWFEPTPELLAYIAEHAS